MPFWFSADNNVCVHALFQCKRRHAYVHFSMYLNVLMIVFVFRFFLVLFINLYWPMHSRIDGVGGGGVGKGDCHYFFMGCGTTTAKMEEGG